MKFIAVAKSLVVVAVYKQLYFLQNWKNEQQDNRNTIVICLNQFMIFGLACPTFTNMSIPNKGPVGNAQGFRHIPGLNVFVRALLCLVVYKIS